MIYNCYSFIKAGIDVDLPPERTFLSTNYSQINLGSVKCMQQRKITQRIVGYHFPFRQSATLNLCPIYFKLLVHGF